MTGKLMIPNKYVALNSLRGFGAIMVALYHARINSFIADSVFVRNGHLFLDFFFVLSGFVIAANYQARIVNREHCYVFLQQRFWRLYPLHIAVLAIYVAMAGVEALFLDGRLGGITGNTFTGARSGWAIVTNVLLIHGLNVHETLTWNLPSWTISAEFWAYVTFGLLTLRAAEGVRWLAVLGVLILPFLLLELNGPTIYTTWQYGYFRCIYGFAAGVVVWNVVKAYGQGGRLKFSSATAATVIETAMLVMIAAFMTFGDAVGGLTTPIVFAFAVAIFTSDQGLPSRFLAVRWMGLLGLWSYSIYMWHFFLIRDATSGLVAVLKVGGINMPGGDGIEALLGVERWQGNLIMLGYLLILLCVSALSYRYIEVPGQNFGKARIAKRIAKLKAQGASQGAASSVAPAGACPPARSSSLRAP